MGDASQTRGRVSGRTRAKCPETHPALVQVVYWVPEEEANRLRTSGSWRSYNAGSWLFSRTIYLHTVSVPDLIPNQTYYYQVGNGLLMSRIFTLRALPTNDPSWVPKIAIYGDLGNENGQSIPWLTNQVDKKEIDVIYHIGDLAYDLNDRQGKTGDEFMRRIEPITSQVAYQVVPGNHESAANFSHYDNLFAMQDQRSGQINNHFYSTTIGPVRIIGISTEFYYFVIYGTSQIGNQYRWLEQELREANKPENRNKHPWVVVVGHRPLYCTSNHGTHCSIDYRALRHGWFGSYGLDRLFYDHQVDVYFSGHMHVYERMFPVFDGHGNASRLPSPYENPWAPVHVIAGSAGCKEYLYKFKQSPPHWSAARISDYGYSMMYPLNHTHLHIQQISVSKVSCLLLSMSFLLTHCLPFPSRQSGQVIDDIMISKTLRGS